MIFNNFFKFIFAIKIQGCTKKKNYSTVGHGNKFLCNNSMEIAVMNLAKFSFKNKIHITFCKQK